MIDIETIKTIATEDWGMNLSSKTVIELINRLEAAESQQVVQELVIQQLREALITSAHVFLHLDAIRCLEEVNKALAIPTSTKHLEAWYKERGKQECLPKKD